MSLSNIAYLIATDPAFEAEMHKNPEKAFADKGISLSPVEMKILQYMA